MLTTDCRFGCKVLGFLGGGLGESLDVRCTSPAAGAHRMLGKNYWKVSQVAVVRQRPGKGGVKTNGCEPGQRRSPPRNGYLKFMAEIGRSSE